MESSSFQDARNGSRQCVATSTPPTITLTEDDRPLIEDWCRAVREGLSPPVFSFYDEDDGEFTVNLQPVLNGKADVDMILAHPYCFFIPASEELVAWRDLDPVTPFTIKRGRDGTKIDGEGRQGVFIDYSWSGWLDDGNTHDGQSDPRIAFAQRCKEQGQLVVWLRWPAEGPKPSIGMTSEDHATLIVRLHYQARAEQELDEAAERGKFPRDSGEQITNTNPEAIVCEDEAPPPLLLREIIQTIAARFRGWPRRVGEVLFVPNGNRIDFLINKDALFGWVSNYGILNWRKQTGCVTQGQFFAELKRQAISYASVEVTPHEPPMKDYFYLPPVPGPGSGAMLERLLDKFCPETPIDRQLIKAFFATLIWGGEPGSRPAFLITADSGRGAGKTKLVQLAALLVGGSIDIDLGEKEADVKKRLLTPAALTKRLALIDNVKTLRMSWGALESWITCHTISGYQNYVGNGERPNTITWAITLNGASLSTDMAQRVIEIKLARPVYEDAWEETTRAFIKEHRLAIVGDIIGLLRRPKASRATRSRWPAWEGEVLARLGSADVDLDAIVAKAVERRLAADVEVEESSLIEEFFGGKLAEHYHDLDDRRVHIPSTVACCWFNAATGERHSTIAASRRIRQMVKEGALSRIIENPCRTNGRGLLWTGVNATDADSVLYDLETRIYEAERRQ